MTDRAQSEAIGFVIVFVLIVAAVSVLTVAGLGELRDVQDDQRVENALASMGILAENVDDLVLDGAPNRETELRLGSGRLTFADPVPITITGHETGNPTANFSYEVTTRPLVYDGGTEQRVVYNAGAVIWQSRTSSTMIDGPPMLVSPDRSSVLVVQTRRGGDNVGIGGTSTALVRADRAVADLFQVNHTSYDVTIRFDSPRADAWTRHFEDRTGMTCSSPSPTVGSCSFTTDSLAVSVVRIDMALR